ncbi:MAG: hypothetical protein KY475_11295, partial [Planctomycetes bacterium]|nr:hypothetical protein [Planctomycetota bacterium]
MQLVNAVLGFVLLAAGRPLYWAFVAIAGFIFGLQLADMYLIEQPDWVQVAVAVLAGVLGALVAIVAIRVAFAIAGFFAGAWLAGAAVEPLAVADGGQLLLLVLGGVIGAVVAAVLMDWAIIALSSLIGAALIVGAFELSQPAAIVAYV